MKYNVTIPDHQHWVDEIKCLAACPVHTDARGYIRAIREGDYEKAYLIARGPNPLASICGRICGAPCELNCRRGSIDRPVSIRALKRFASDQYTHEDTTQLQSALGQIQALSNTLDCADRDEMTCLSALLKNGGAPRANGERVAIIGSGPAGLAAAHDLAILGFRPTIYEMENLPAGMLALGVPEYRLPRAIIQAEVNVIQSLGVDIRTGLCVGRDVTLSELMDKHSAVIIAVGAKRSGTLPIKGIDAKGVLGGVEFLRDVSLNNPVEMGRSVIVIGGGNVASDVSRTALRQMWSDVSRTVLRRPHTQDVHLCCLESREEMPADDIEIKEAFEEGVIFHNGIGPDEILADSDNQVQGVRFKQVLSVFDARGRFSPVFDPDATTVIEADTVLLAIGQRFDFSFIDPKRDGIEITERGLIDVGENLSTTRPGVFVAGDAAQGPKLMIDAIASGKHAARSVYEYVTGRTLSFEETVLHFRLPGYSREAGFERAPNQRLNTTSPAARRVSQKMEVELGYTEKQALLEAERCLDCGVNTIFDGSKCILCGGCVDVCPEVCLKLVSIDSLTGDPSFASWIGNWQLQHGAVAGAIIKNDDRCTRCALCVERCPVEAITMERFNYKETCHAVRPTQ